MTGFTSAAYTATSNALIQKSVTEAFRGNMNSIYGMIMGIPPLSILIVGAMADVLEAPLATTIMESKLAVVMLLTALFSRRLSRME